MFTIKIGLYHCYKLFSGSTVSHQTKNEDVWEEWSVETKDGGGGGGVKFN